MMPGRLTLPDRKKDGVGRRTYAENLKCTSPERHANALKLLAIIVPIIISTGVV
jgi:hypothetical protein